MSNIKQPYLGITGIDYPEQGSRLSYEVSCRSPLFLGVLLKQKYLYDPNYTKPRYPNHKLIKDIFAAIKPGHKALHYCASTPPTSKELEDIVKLTGPIDAIQFNGEYPKPEVLEELPIERIILQVKNESDLNIAEWYSGFATDLLIDMSGGRGKPLDVKVCNIFTKVLPFSSRYSGWYYSRYYCTIGTRVS